MNYITYGVKATCINTKGLPSEEFLSELIDATGPLTPDQQDDEHYTANAIDLLYENQEQGYIPESADIERDYIVIITYGEFQVQRPQLSLAK